MTLLGYYWPWGRCSSTISAYLAGEVTPQFVYSVKKEVEFDWPRRSVCNPSVIRTGVPTRKKGRSLWCSKTSSLWSNRRYPHSLMRGSAYYVRWRCARSGSTLSYGPFILKVVITMHRNYGPKRSLCSLISLSSGTASLRTTQIDITSQRTVASHSY